MRKQIDLPEKVIKELKRLALMEGRKLKPFIERTLCDIANNSILQIKK